MAREDKIRTVDRGHSDVRLGDARAFLQQAEISMQLVDGSRRSATAASSAVLSGIAACDAACAFSLGEVAGSHDQAPRLLERVAGSEKAVADLSRLLAVKTAAQYAGKSLGERQAVDAISRARRLLAFAESLRR